jgi:hypothetical protein
VQSQTEEDDNGLVLVLLLVGVGGFGLFSVSALLAPVQSWLVAHGVLVSGGAAIISWGPEHVGLDFARMAVVGGVLLVLLLLGVFVARRRRSKARV